jgi:hypothetical protein
MEKEIRQLAEKVRWKAHKTSDGKWFITDSHNSMISKEYLSDQEALDFLKKHAHTLGMKLD